MFPLQKKQGELEKEDKENVEIGHEIHNENEVMETDEIS